MCAEGLKELCNYRSELVRTDSEMHLLKKLPKWKSFHSKSLSLCLFRHDVKAHRQEDEQNTE